MDATNHELASALAVANHEIARLRAALSEAETTLLWLTTEYERLSAAYEDLRRAPQQTGVTRGLPG